MPKTELQKRIERLIREHKGLRAAARAVDIDPAYLVRMRDGDKSNPTPETLKKLGLQRVETVRPI